jgi:hypothetical protein
VVFRLFRRQQRAIGELMMVPTGEAHGPRHECMAYTAFCAKLDGDEVFAGWFARLRADVDSCSRTSRRSAAGSSGSSGR